jgi:N6-adenosine-specific RNA methylase IME4
VVKFRVHVSDPPWPFDDALPGETRGAGKQYRCLSIADIKAGRGFVLPEMADDSLLLLWRVGAMQQEALDVADAWGFVPKGELVWVKTRGDKLAFGMGRIFRYAHETCLVATRGRASTEVVMDHGIRSVFSGPVGRHSEKPDEFYDIVERLAPGPRCETFARRRRPNWTQFGDQLPPLEPGFQDPAGPP